MFLDKRCCYTVQCSRLICAFYTIVNGYKLNGDEMIKKDYNRMIIERIEKSFNKVIPVGAIAAWLACVIIPFSTIPRIFIVIDFSIGLLFFVMYILRHKISAIFKIYVTIMVPIPLAVYSFMHGGFDSAAITLVIISNLVAVLFLDKRRSRLIAYMSIVIFIFLFVDGLVGHSVENMQEFLVIWSIQMFVLLVTLFILHTVVISIKSYLIEKLEELENSVAKIYELAYYDHLTGLPNTYQLKKMIKDDFRKDKCGFLIIINLRNLGLINTLYNDQFGDLVISKIGNLLDSYIKSEEIVARISGNEFALWLKAKDVKKLETRIEDYVIKMYQDLDIPKLTRQVQFCIGYAMCHEKKHVDMMFHRARMALTFAKSNRQHIMVKYDDTIEDHFKMNELKKARLEHALTHKSFEVYYQAKVSAETCEVVGVEALARWDDEVLGKVSPDEFIEMVERMNLYVPFGHIVLEQVFKDFEHLKEKYGEHVIVSTNISPSYMTSGSFLKKLKHFIYTYDMPGEQLKLEITEEVMIKSFEYVKSLMDMVKEFGVLLSLDDFGSGYSSLKYLAELPIDEIKIDKSFALQVFQNKNMEMMINLIIELSHGLNLNIVVEGVETKEQYEYFKGKGIDEIQGYYFAKPEALSK